MKNISTPIKKFHRLTSNIILFLFIFNTIFPFTPGANAQLPDITYVTSYGYDNNGNITSQTTPNGHSIQFTYDNLNRLIKKTYPDLSEVSYVYDANGNRTSMTDSHGTTYYDYDWLNRLRSVQYPGIYPIYYDYNKAGNLTRITYPTGEEVSYSYDSSNRLISVTDDTGTTSYQYSDQTNNLIRTILLRFCIYLTDVINRET